MIPLTLSDSEVTNYTRCKRKWYLKNWMGLQRKGRIDNLDFGTKIHTIWETLYMEGEEQARETQKEIFPDSIFNDKKEKKFQKLSEAMLEGYIEYIQTADQHMETISAETIYQSQLDDDTTIQCIYDLLYYNHKKGRHEYIDHKTASNALHSLNLKVASQPKHYLLVAELSDKEESPEEGVYNYALKQFKSSRQDLFWREPAQVPTESLNQYARYLTSIAAEMRSDLDRDTGDIKTCWPANYQWDCSGCDFKHLCPAYDHDGDTETIIQLNYIKTDPNARYKKE